MKLEERGRKNVSVQHLSPRHDGMSAKKTKNNIIDNLLFSVFVKHFFVVYNDIKNEMKNFESFMD